MLLCVSSLVLRNLIAAWVRYCMINFIGSVFPTRYFSSSPRQFIGVWMAVLHRTKWIDTTFYLVREYPNKGYVLRGKKKKTTASSLSPALTHGNICAQPTDIYSVPRFQNNTYARHGPTVWDSLADFIWNPAISTDCFRRVLKTYWFTLY